MEVTKRVELQKGRISIVIYPVFLPDHAIVGILCSNQRRPPQKLKKGQFSPSLFQGCRLNTGIVF